MGLLNYLGGRGSSAFGEGLSRHVESDVVTVGGVALQARARVRPRLDHAIRLDHGRDRFSGYLGRSRGGPPRARFLWRQGDSIAQHSDRLAGMVRTSVSRPVARYHCVRGHH